MVLGNAFRMDFLGIDLGTSELKVALVGEDGRVRASAAAPIRTHQPRPLWSEQDPAHWWQAAEAAMAGLRAAGWRLDGVRGIGVAGQMHGAVLLDAREQVLRPAILWNDGRSSGECRALEQAVRRSRSITGNIAMPGFTAPKLLWLRTHERRLFSRIRRVLLPKDWLVHALTGEASTDMSDASGTLWLDVARRRWSAPMLDACGLGAHQMPRLQEGSSLAGRLRADVAARWGLPAGCSVAAGAGDNAAVAVGLGQVEPGGGFVSLGTSGVAFLVSDGFRPNTRQAVHAFCHAVPRRWHQMAVMLSAAGSLNWAAAALGYADVPAMMAEADGLDRTQAGQAPWFLPYLAGERSPHNDPHASGVFFGLRPTHGRSALAYAVAEGVAFAMADCMESVDAAGQAPQGLRVVGGATRSAQLLRLMASASGVPLRLAALAQHAAALGAASLAACAHTGSLLPAAADGADAHTAVVRPDPDWAETLAPRRKRFCALYAALRGNFDDMAKHPMGGTR